MVLFAIRCFSGVRGTYEIRRTVKRNRAIRPHIHRGQWSSENRSRIHRGKRGRPICAAHTNKRQNVRRQGGGPRRAHQMAGWHWYDAVRAPPERGDFSAVVSHDAPLSASMEVIFWG